MWTQTNKELFSNGFVKLLKEQQADVLLKACDGDEKVVIYAHKIIPLVTSSSSILLFLLHKMISLLMFFH